MAFPLPFTGLFTNFDSLIPMSFKCGVVYTLLDRYFKIFSSYKIFHSKVIVLKKFLLTVVIWLPFFDCCLKVFLSKIAASKSVIYFCLPFTGACLLEICTKLIKIISSCFPQVNLHLTNFFSFKDQTPKFLTSHVVYKFKCQCCGALYFRQTHCHLYVHISEDMEVLALTRKKQSRPFPSSILNHSTKMCQPISFDNFSVLSSSNSMFEWLIQESLLISKFKPLNESSSVVLSLFWFLCFLSFFSSAG